MHNGIVTECPECETRFNVSDGQLRLADGKVRCGACLTVFDARAHQPYSGDGPEQRHQPEPAPETEPEPADALPSESAPDADDDADRLEIETPLPVTFLPDGPMSQQPPEQPPRQEAETARHRADVYYWTPDPGRPQPEAPRRPASPPATEPAPDRSTAMPGRDITGTTERAQTAPAALPTLSLSDLHAEPLELERGPEPEPPGAILGWSLGCAAALLLLAAQLLWFNRIELSRQPELGGFYEVLCNQVICGIPPRQSVTQIRNHQLVVRAHPEYKDALSVHLLLENAADFRQPFPAIDLMFSDIRGRTVASRRLQPADYLDDSLDPLNMTPALPYQISVDILDPGRRAVSYEVRLAPASL